VTIVFAHTFVKSGSFTSNQDRMINGPLYKYRRIYFTSGNCFISTDSTFTNRMLRLSVVYLSCVLWQTVHYIPKICFKNQIGNGLSESNDHVTYDVTWSRKVKVIN